MKKPLTLFLLVSTLASAGVKTNYYNAQPMVVSNLLVQSGITLGGSNITAWSQIGGTSGTDSNTVNALIAAGTSLNASNWLGSTAFSNWLHTAFYPLTLNPSNYVSLAQVWSAGALTNNWTGGPVTIDALNTNTNQFSGSLTILGLRVQSGEGTTASGDYSHAVGLSSTASGPASHAEGSSTTASGDSSHAEGNTTIASGRCSHAAGESAKATNDNTFVWSDGTSFGSTLPNQFSTYASNGYRLLGGPITGDGSLIINVNALTLGGVALAGLVQTNAALDRLRLNDGGGLTNLPSLLTDLGQVSVQSNIIAAALLRANAAYAFTPTNGLDVYNNVQSLLLTNSLGAWRLISPSIRIIQNYTYSGWASSNLFTIMGYDFTASPNFASLTTNNFVATFGTVSPHVNSVIASNADGNAYTTNSTPTGTYPGSAAFYGGVLLPDGRVFCVPYNSTSARIYNPATDTLTTPTGTYPGSGAFRGGVLLPDGRVFCVPGNSTSARIYNPATDTLTTPSGTYPGSAAFIGGVLLPDGRVFCVPYNSTSARIAGPTATNNFSLPVLLGPTFNKL
jgi:hypothetical protein